jgi:hypothetical protein
MLLLSVCAVCTVLVRPTTGTVVLPVDVYRGTVLVSSSAYEYCFCCSVDLARLHKLTTKEQTDNKSNHAVHVPVAIGAVCTRTAYSYCSTIVPPAVLPIVPRPTVVQSYEVRLASRLIGLHAYR